MTRRIEPFLFSNMTQGIEPILFSSMTQRIELFFWYWLKEVNVFLNMIQRIEFFWTWLKRIEPSSFWSMTQRIDFFLTWFKELNFFMTHKIEPPFWRRLKESNPFFWTQHQKLNFCLKIQKATRKIKPFSEKYDSKNCFFCFSFSQNDSNIWIFSYDSKNWTSCYEPLFNMTQRDEVLFFFFFWLKELKPFVFLKMSQRIEPLFHMSYFFTRLKELNFFNMTQRFFQIDSKEMTLFLQNDAQNWTLILNVTQRMEPFFLWIRRKELNPFVFECDAKNWILFLWIWRKELKALSLNMTGKELNPFSLNKLTQRLESFFL